MARIRELCKRPTIDVMRGSLANGLFSETETFAIDVILTVGGLKQYKPIRPLVDWMATLGAQEQTVIEAALHASGYLDTFKADALDRWPRQGDNQLLHRLRDY